MHPCEEKNDGCKELLTIPRIFLDFVCSESSEDFAPYKSYLLSLGIHEYFHPIGRKASDNKPYYRFYD